MIIKPLALIVALAGCDNYTQPAAMVPAPQQPFCIIICRVQIEATNADNKIGDLDGTFTGGTYAPGGDTSTTAGGAKTITEVLP